MSTYQKILGIYNIFLLLGLIALIFVLPTIVALATSIVYLIVVFLFFILPMILGGIMAVQVLRNHQWRVQELGVFKGLLVSASFINASVLIIGVVLILIAMMMG